MGQQTGVNGIQTQFPAHGLGGFRAVHAEGQHAAGAMGLAAAIHATAYLTGEERRHFPRFWLFFLLTIAAMAGVVLSSSLFGFLLAWETMGLASAGLVAFENEARPAKKATWIYLMACHAGACALMLAGVLLARGELAVAALTLGFVGFGLKIGFPPFHVWLPEAHPAAPAPARGRAGAGSCLCR